MQIEYLKTSSIKPYEKNAKSTIKNVKYCVPLILNENIKSELVING